MEIRNIADEIRERGGDHQSRVYLLAKEKASPELARAMNLPRGGTVFHSIIVHSDTGRPVQHSNRYVNPAVAPHYLEQDFTRITPNQYLIQMAPVTEVEHIIETTMPDKKIQGLLEMEPGEPCLVLHRRTWTYSDVATRSVFMYPGKRYQIGGRFKPTDGPSLLVA